MILPKLEMHPRVILFVFLFSVYFTPVLLNQISNALIVSDQQSNEETLVEVDEENDNIDIFQPKKYWQIVKPGQSVPRGLHIRMNLQNGQKEAKLLSDANDETGDETPSHNHPKFTSNKFSPETLKEALKNMKVEELADLNPKTSKTKLRTLEELKKEFKELNLNVQSETDILVDLMKRYRNVQIESEKISVLQDMEYVAHQFDVAQDMVNLKCFELLLPDLNSSDSNVRSLVAETLGAAMQGNLRVQTAILELNGLSIFLRVILFDESYQVRAKGLYALGCLLRHFPFAQQRFLLNGGLQSLGQVLKEESSALLELRKMKLKVVTLIYDLLVEQDFAEKYQDTKYQKLPIRSHLVQNGFCDLVSDLLELQDMDIVGRVIPTMVSLNPDCKFRKKLETLVQLSELFMSKLDLDKSDQELESLLDDTKQLVQMAKDKEEL